MGVFRKKKKVISKVLIAILTLFVVNIEKVSAIDAITTFDYTGDVQEYVAPYTGTYILETWGAQGGSFANKGNYGGYGGYSIGALTLTKGEKLYIYVGGQPNSYAGGYNGGGNGGSYGGQEGYGGGGATHIATIPGLLSELSEQRSNILMVAGGGSGAGNASNITWDSKYGSGGGSTGNDGYDYYNDSDTNFIGIGGKKTEGGYCLSNANNSSSKGSFGKGGDNYHPSDDEYGGPGGGGGYFGGGGSARSHASGGGGTGYISNNRLPIAITAGISKHMAVYEGGPDSGLMTKTISVSCHSETPTTDCAKEGNGYAKISIYDFLSTDATLKSLSVDGYELKQAFRPYRLNYDVEIGQDVTSVQINATVNDENATVSYNSNVNITSDPQVEYITVTAQDGTVKIYALNIITNIREATLITGVQFNDKLRTFNPISFREATEVEYNAVASTLTTDNIVSTSDSEYPVYLWADSDSNALYYSEADTIYANENSERMFYQLNYLVDVDVAGIDTSRVTNMEQMFYNSDALISLDLSSFDTSNVTSLAGMFEQSDALVSIDFTGWDVRKVERFTRMFCDTGSLVSLDLSSFVTSSATNMTQMFTYCRSLRELDISNFDTSNVTNMDSMFNGCSNLEAIDVTSFDTSNVENMSDMFANCEKIKTLDLSSFNVNKVRRTSQIFYDDYKLTTIYVDPDKWGTLRPQYYYRLFSSNYRIMGQNGTSYVVTDDASYHLARARVDDPDNGNPGYFTDIAMKGQNLHTVTYPDGSTIVMEHNSGLDLEPNETTNGTYESGEITFVYHNGVTDPTTSHQTVTWVGDGYTADGVHYIDNGISWNNSFWVRVNKDIVLEYAYRPEVINQEFPVAEKEGKIFSGWYTEAEGGEKVTSYTGTEPITLHAQYNNIESYLDQGYNISSRINNLSNYADTINTFRKATEEEYNLVKNSLGENNIISTEDSPVPTYMWYDGENILYYSVSDVIYMNSYSSGMFSGTNLVSIDLSGLNSSRVENMSAMFDNASKLTNIIFGNNWDTSKVTNMSQMFTYCPNLTTLDLSSFDTSNVTNMYQMFGNSGFTTLDLSNFDTSSATNIGYMFYYDSNLTNLNISRFNTSNVYDMSYMFYGCNSLQTLDISSFDPSNTYEIYDMFSNATNLKTIYVSELFDNSVLAEYSSMFYDNTQLVGEKGTTFDPDKIYPEYARIDDPENDKPGYFTYKEFKPIIYYPDGQTEEVELFSLFTLPSEYSMPDEILATVTFDYNVPDKDDEYGYVTKNYMVNNWKIGGTEYEFGDTLTVKNDIHLKADYVETILPAEFPEKPQYNYSDFLGWYTKPVGGEKVESYNGSTPITLYAHWNDDVAILMDGQDFHSRLMGNFDTTGVFKYATLEEYNLAKDTFTDINIISDSTSPIPVYMWQDGNDVLYYSEAPKIFMNKRTDWMFESADFTDIDVTHFDTSKVIKMDGLFKYCRNITTLDLSNFDTSNVENMASMFQGDANLVELDLSNFDTRKVESFSAMFDGCTSLTDLNISSFDTSNAKNIEEFFRGCSSLTSIDVTRFDTSKVINMNHMFMNCSSLLELDLSSFDTSSLEYADILFGYDNYLTTIYVDPNKWDISNASTNSNFDMFLSDYDIIGQNGTEYDGNYHDKVYAVVDDPDNGRPGYLTDIAMKGITHSVTYPDGTTEIKNHNSVVRLSDNETSQPNEELATVTFIYNDGETDNTTDTVKLTHHGNGYLVNGDTWYDNTNPRNKIRINEDKVITYSYDNEVVGANLPEPTRDGYIFDGWWTEETGGELIEEYTEEEDITLYAHWLSENITIVLPDDELHLSRGELYTIPINDYDKVDENPINITYKLHNGEDDVVDTIETTYIQNGWLVNGVYYDNETDIIAGGEVHHVPVNPNPGEWVEVPGLIDPGWGVEDPGLDPGSVVAQPPVIEADVITLVPNYIEVTTDNTLLKPSYQDHMFEGWYTEETGGEKIEDLNTLTEDTILHARWESHETITITLPDRVIYHPKGEEFVLPENTIEKPTETVATVTFKYNHNDTPDYVTSVQYSYIPSGWTLNDTHYDTNAKITPEEDITLTPDYVLTVKGAEWPDDPTFDDAYFSGWYLEGEQERYYGYDGNEDIVLIANLSLYQYTITYDNGDVELHNHQDKILVPESMTFEDRSLIFDYNDNSIDNETITYNVEKEVVNYEHVTGAYYGNNYYTPGKEITVYNSMYIIRNYGRSIYTGDFPSVSNPKFIGWFTEKDSGSLLNNYTEYRNSNTNIDTLYAHYEEDGKATVILDGKVVDTLNIGETYTLPDGTNFDKDVSTVNFVNGDDVTTAKVHETKEFDHYEINGVSYNSGSTITVNDTVYINTIYTNENITPVTINDLDDTEFKYFRGWFEQEDGKGTKYTGDYSDKVDLTLYAYFEGKEASITGRIEIEHNIYSDIFYQTARYGDTINTSEAEADLSTYGSHMVHYIYNNNSDDDSYQNIEVRRSINHWIDEDGKIYDKIFTVDFTGPKYLEPVFDKKTYAYMDYLSGIDGEYPGHQFIGWYTKPVGGEKVSVITEDKDIDLYAHWRRLDNINICTMSTGEVFECPNDPNYTYGVPNVYYQKVARVYEITNADGGYKNYIHSIEDINRITPIKYYEIDGVKYYPGENYPVHDNNPYIKVVYAGESSIVPLELNTRMYVDSAYFDDGKYRTFLGWYTEPEGGDLVTTYDGSEDIFVYAHYGLESEEQLYYFSFNKLDGSNVSLTLKDGTPINLNDSNSYYRYFTLYKENGEDPVNETIMYTTTGKTFNVNKEAFEANEVYEIHSDTYIEPLEVDHEAHYYPEIEEPTRDGYKFIGWSYQDNILDLNDPEFYEMVQGGNVYAMWEPYDEDNDVVVTFDDEVRIVPKGTTEVLPTDTDKSDSFEIKTHTLEQYSSETLTVNRNYSINDYMVNGEVIDKGQEITYNEDTIITTNYDISYDYDENTANNYNITYPELPTLDDQYFLGWWDQPLGGNKLEDVSSIKDKTTIYARYVQKYLLTIDGNGSYVREGYIYTVPDAILDSFNRNNQLVIYVDSEGNYDYQEVIIGYGTGISYQIIDGERYNTNEIYVVNKDTVITSEYTNEKKPVMYPYIDIPTKEGSVFMGWKLNTSEDDMKKYNIDIYQLTPEDICFQNSYINAIWQEYDPETQAVVHYVDEYKRKDYRVIYDKGTTLTLDDVSENTSSDISLIENINHTNNTTVTINTIANVNYYLINNEQYNVGSTYTVNDNTEIEINRSIATTYNCTGDYCDVLDQEPNTRYGEYIYKGTFEGEGSNYIALDIYNMSSEQFKTPAGSYDTLWLIFEGNSIILTVDNEVSIIPKGLSTIPKASSKDPDIYKVTYNYNDGVTDDVISDVTVNYVFDHYTIEGVGDYEALAEYDYQNDTTMTSNYTKEYVYDLLSIDDDKFEGWYTLPDGGEKVESLDGIDEDITLYARWGSPYPTDIEIDQDDILISVGDTHVIGVTFVPDDSLDTITYTGYDENIISVTDGIITGLSKGETTITVGTENTDITKEITVKVLNNVFESSTYEVRSKENNPKIIIGADPETTIADFKANLDNPIEYIKIYDLDNNLLSDDDIVKTGIIIKLEYENRVLDEATMVVRGDVDGDGYVNISDYILVANHALGTEEMDDYLMITAGDVEEDGILNIADYIIIMDYGLGNTDNLNNN